MHIIVYQNLRSVTKTSNHVNAAQYVDITKAAVRGLFIAARASVDSSDGDSLPVLQAKRGMPKSRNRVDPGWNAAPENYWPSEAVSAYILIYICLHLNMCIQHNFPDNPYTLQEVLECVFEAHKALQSLFNNTLDSGCGTTFNLWTARRNYKWRSKSVSETVGLRYEKLYKLQEYLVKVPTVSFGAPTIALDPDATGELVSPNPLAHLMARHLHTPAPVPGATTTEFDEENVDYRVDAIITNVHE